MSQTKRPGYRFFATTVSAIDTARPTMVRIVCSDASLADFSPVGLDQRIKLLFPPAGGELPLADLRAAADTQAARELLLSWRGNERAPHIRTYTVRRIDPARGELTIDLVRHGTTAPSARWLADVRVGSPLWIYGPERHTPADFGVEWAPGAAERVLLAGDETALPAIASILESGTIRPNVRICVVIEVGDRRDVEPLCTPRGADVHICVRTERQQPGAAMEGGVRQLLAAQPDLLAGGAHGARPSSLADTDGHIGELMWDVPEGERTGGPYAWLAGEAGAVTRLRRLLVSELGVDRADVSFMGYWKIGRAG